MKLFVVIAESTDHHPDFPYDIFGPYDYQQAKQKATENPTHFIMALEK